MILEVFLHSLKSAGVGGDLAPPFANRLPACGVEKVHMASVFASPGVGGTHGVFITGSERGHIWVLFLLTG